MDLKKKANYLRLASTEIIEQALKDAFAAGLEEAARMADDVVCDALRLEISYRPSLLEPIKAWMRQLKKEIEARAQAARK